MARTKQFDTDAVVTSAMEVFWSKGYEATSIQDLVDAMGINRGSLYGAFGDKAGLFEASVRRYQQDAPSQRLVENAADGAPREEIELFFSSLLERALAPGGHRGCLIINSIAELSARDIELAARLKDGVRRLEDALCTLVRRGQDAGDIARGRDPRAAARALQALAHGLILLSKTNPGEDTLGDIAGTALSLLD